MKTTASAKKNTERDLLLFEACEQGNVRPVQDLLSGDTSVNVHDCRDNWLGVTLLMYAVRGGQGECVRILLADGANPNLTDRLIPLGGGGRTALHFAAENGNCKIVSLLLRQELT